MSHTARALLPLAVFFLFTACQSQPLAPRPSAPPAATLGPSPNLLVGRVLAVDSARHFAIVELASAAPAAALAPDAALLTRTDDLQPTARLQTTRQVRGRTLGAMIVSGSPNVGDEVVFPPNRQQL